MKKSSDIQTDMPGLVKRGAGILQTDASALEAYKRDKNFRRVVMNLKDIVDTLEARVNALEEELNSYKAIIHGTSDITG